MPGDYVVLVSKLDQPKVDPANSIAEDDPAYNGEPIEQVIAPRNLLPASFGKRESSTLKATVGADPVEGLKLDLGS